MLPVLPYNPPPNSMSRKAWGGPRSLSRKEDLLERDPPKGESGGSPVDIGRGGKLVIACGQVESLENGRLIDISSNFGRSPPYGGKPVGLRGGRGPGSENEGARLRCTPLKGEEGIPNVGEWSITPSNDEACRFVKCFLQNINEGCSLDFVPVHISVRFQIIVASLIWEG